MKKHIKEEFYSNTTNVGLSFISLGLFGIISFYYFDFLIIFSLMKSIFLVGILILILSIFYKKINISVQDKFWLLALGLTLLFTFNTYFDISPEVLENVLYKFEDNSIDSDIQILGTKNTKKIIAKYNISDLVKENQSQQESVVYDKNLIDMKNEVLSIYNNSLSTNKTKLLLYINNIDIVNVDTLINTIYLKKTNQLGNTTNVKNFNFDNLKNAKFIRNYFYYEENGIVITGTLKIDNSIVIKVRPKNYIFKSLGI